MSSYVIATTLAAVATLSSAAGVWSREQVKNRFVCPDDWKSHPSKLYPDEYNPRFFYKCTGSWLYGVVSSRQECPEHSIFNEDIHACWYVNGPTPKLFQCPEDWESHPDRNYPHPHKPWMYFSCFTGKPVRLQCDRKFVFNDITNKCESEKTPKNAKEFQCPPDWKIRNYFHYPDKYHSNFFYSCYGDGKKPLYRWFRCPPNHVFQESVHECIPKA